MCALFAATHPERTLALVMYGSYARRAWAPDYPWGATQEHLDALVREIRERWGEPVLLDLRAPSLAGDQRFRQWWATYLTRSASPGAVVALTRMNYQIDIRHVLPTIRVPTLVIHRTGDVTLPVEASRYMAQRVPGARLVEVPGEDHLPFVGDQDAILTEIEEFLTWATPAPEPDRILATVLFTDIVGSTERASEMGDRRWRDLLERYRAVVRAELRRYRGREIDTAGDSFLASFDGPARAIRCACAIRDAARGLGIEIRAGLHTGEVEVMGSTIGGIAVHIGARVAALAGAGEVLASSTVRDLVAGSGILFQERGRHALKGVPGEWQVCAVECGGWPRRMP
ncbi:MAG: adenylate/guanylate cyclase domain-containing protein [Armatimonadota bacterium]|nr:adenylate/guanylate cyclase domain-containing protein [Armatimonadota bacterium]